MANSLLDRLEGLVSRFEEVSTLITDPSVIADQKRYIKLTKEYKDLGKIVDARKEYVGCLQNISDAKEMLAMEDDAETKEMLREELSESEKRIPELEDEIKLLLVPADPEDDKNVIMEIRGGTGGDEAAIFAGDLFRMYSKYIETKGWKMAISSFSEGSSGGYKEIIFSVTGEGVYGIMKYESGVHRVQRVPATETQGRVHTSAATVAVLPEAEEFDVEINEGASQLVVEYDEHRRVAYPFALLEELELSYAITIHKAQGSEYQAVIMPLLSGPRMLFNRNLLYTGVTRAKSCVTILGSSDTVRGMINNESENRRYTALAQRIIELEELERGDQFEDASESI